MKHRVVEILAITPASLKEVREVATELYLNGGGKLVLVVNIAQDQKEFQKQYVPELLALMDFLREQEQVTVDVLGLRVMDSVALLLFTGDSKACVKDCLFAFPLEHQFQGLMLELLRGVLDGHASLPTPEEAPTRKSLHFDAQEAKDWQLVDDVDATYLDFVKSLNWSS